MSGKQNEDIECPYCGENFDSELEKGVHISEEHIKQGESISKPTKGAKSDNLIEDWKQGKD